jgi:hypothetical protein
MQVSESIFYQIVTKHVSIYELMQTTLYYRPIWLKVTISQQLSEVPSHTKFKCGWLKDYIEMST